SPFHAESSPSGSETHGDLKKNNRELLCAIKRGRGASRQGVLMPCAPGGIGREWPAIQWSENGRKTLHGRENEMVCGKGLIDDGREDADAQSESTREPDRGSRAN